MNLVGGAITSTNAGNSELTANRLAFEDVRNTMDYSATSASVGGGTCGTAGSYQGTATQLGGAGGASFSGGVPMQESGSDSSTTYATLTEGNITLGGQRTTAAELGVHTDAATAHTAIRDLPDLQQVLADQRAMSAATGTVISTAASIRNEINASIDEIQRTKDDAAALLNDPTLSADQKARLVLVAVEADREIERLQKVGVLVGALAGGVSAASGDTGGMVAGTLAPVISYQIGQYFKENAARNVMDGEARGEEGSASHLLSHALLGAAVAAAGGDNLLIGGIAAAGAEAAAPALAKYLYGKDASDLNAEQKSTISAIVGLGGAVIGTFGSDLSALASGSAAARNAVDNNWGEVGHYSTMATVLYLAGFSEKDAKAIALAAWAPDTDSRNAITKPNVLGGGDPAGAQQSIHLLDGENDPKEVVARQQELGRQVAAILAVLKQYENDPSAKAAILSDARVQRVLHAFGDSYAHVESDGTHYEGGRGHLWDGTKPDRPDGNPGAYISYATDLFRLASEVSGGGGTVSQQDVTSLARSVTNVASEEGQKEVLRNALQQGVGSSAFGLVNSPVRDCVFFQDCGDLKPGSLVAPIIRQVYGLGSNQKKRGKAGGE